MIRREGQSHVTENKKQSVHLTNRVYFDDCEDLKGG